MCCIIPDGCKKYEIKKGKIGVFEIYYYLCMRIGKRGVAQSGSAPALGAGGRRFESCHPD